jgi:hypothetical protein
MARYKLGCKLVPHEPQLRFADYFDSRVQLPTPPAEFGHDGLVKDWQMLGNDTVGDCAIAGPYHAEMLFNAEGGRSMEIDTTTVLKTYSTITGYDPSATDPETGENPTDQGSDPHEVALYWQSHGLTDTAGNNHRIGAFVDLTPGNLTELWLGTWLFGAAGVALALPGQWMDDDVWDALPDPQIEGGHYVLGISRRDGNLGIVTWGGIRYMTPAGYQQANVRTLVYVSDETLTNGVDLEGFNLAQLRADLHLLPRAA